jgi:hypothetical protein
MISITNKLGRSLAALLGVLLVGLMPAAGRAEKVMFRNECRNPVVVQMATVKGGVVRRDQPILLRYGECTPKIKADIDRVVTIYDGKANRVLFQEVLKASKKEAYYSIVFDPRRPGRVQVILRPAKTMPSTTKPKSSSH